MTEPVPYTALHSCATCKTRVHLRVFPVEGGWVCGTGCNCRNRAGGPQQYSTEIEGVFPTFDAAEEAKDGFSRDALELA